MVLILCTNLLYAMEHRSDQIVIIGGGFAGVRCALDLARHNYLLQGRKIVVIDQNPYHLFTPLLYERATTGVQKKSLAIPFKIIFQNKPIRFIHGTVKRLEAKTRKVILGNGQSISYEFLVIAAGSQVETFNIPGLEKHALYLKTLDDAELIYNQIQTAYKRFASSHQQGDLFQILIGGGGFTGVELAAELHNMLKNLARQYEKDQGTFVIKIIEGGNDLLGGRDPWISHEAQKRLGMYRRLEVLIQSRIAKVTSKTVELQNGDSLAYDIFIWTGGVRANILMEHCGLKFNQRCRIETRMTLQSKEDSQIFVIGDAARVIDPETHQESLEIIADAYRQGNLAADNIINIIQKRPLKNYRHKTFGYVVPIRGHWAISNLLNIHLKGRIAWLVLRLVHLRYLLSILPWKEAFKCW